ncbi:MAG: phosphoglycerate kinase [Chlamydiales bacterium]
MLKLKDFPLKGKRVLMRVDFNVPLSNAGKIEDDTRIREALPSIEYILNAGASLVLMSHLGRPDGKKIEKFSLEPCAAYLANLLKKPVRFVKDCVGGEVERAVNALKPGEVLLLENLRFYRAEEEPDLDPTFAQQLAKLGDFYVNDAFGTSHRAHTSTYSVAKLFPGKAAIGLLMEKELSYLQPLLTNPERPFYAIIGGAKISSKIGVLKSLFSKVDALFIGGGMAYTFFKAEGVSIGESICEENQVSKAKDLLKESKLRDKPLFLPKDLVIANKVDQKAQTQIISALEGIPSGWQGVDIGPETRQIWAKELKKAKTIFWNGPVGIFEIPAFAKGTEQLAQTLATLASTRIIGGGDSVSAINHLGISKNFTHLSTGGGATLEFIEHGRLPGLEALNNF